MATRIKGWKSKHCNELFDTKEEAELFDEKVKLYRALKKNVFKHIDKDLWITDTGMGVGFKKEKNDSFLVTCYGIGAFLDEIEAIPSDFKKIPK